MWVMLISLAAASAADLPPFFGVTAGAPIAQSRCADRYAAPGPETCWWRDADTVAAPADGTVSLHLANGPLPFAMSEQPRITLAGGRVAAITIGTSGAAFQDATYRALTAKLGKPAYLARVPVRNLAGAAFVAITAEWRYANGTVLFDGLRRDDVTRGAIYISTREYTAKLRADAGRPVEF